MNNRLQSDSNCLFPLPVLQQFQEITMRTLLNQTGSLVVCAMLLSACSADVPQGGQETVMAKSTTSVKAELPLITVYKSPTCGCCTEWVTYLEDEGFSVTAIDHDDVDQIKAENGLTDPSLKSCHTALVDGYVVEGHVPASDIEKLLAERPDVIGLTAPGMPMMSPGMNSLIPKDYDVLAFQKNGKTRVFSSY